MKTTAMLLASAAVAALQSPAYAIHLSMSDGSEGGGAGGDTAEVLTLKELLDNVTAYADAKLNGQDDLPILLGGTTVTASDDTEVIFDVEVLTMDFVTAILVDGTVVLKYDDDTLTADDDGGATVTGSEGEIVFKLDADGEEVDSDGSDQDAEDTVTGGDGVVGDDDTLLLGDGDVGGEVIGENQQD